MVELNGRARLSGERHLLYMARCLADSNLQPSVVSGDTGLRTESIAGVSRRENMSLVCEMGTEISTAEFMAEPGLGCGHMVSLQSGGQTTVL